MKLSTSDLHVLLSSLLFLPFVVALIVAWRRGALKDVESAKYVVLDDPDRDFWANPSHKQLEVEIEAAKELQ